MKIIIIAILSLLILASGASSQDSPAESRVFEFYLYYDQGLLSLDNETVTPYDIVDSPYAESSGANSFVGKVVSSDGRELEFSYALVKGRNNIQVPYLEKASYVSFSDSKGYELILVSVREGDMLCDYDKVCNRPLGESVQSCPNDCKESTVLPITSVSPTVAPVDSPAGAGFTPFVFIGAFLLVGIIVAFFMFRSRNTSI